MITKQSDTIITLANWNPIEESFELFVRGDTARINLRLKNPSGLMALAVAMHQQDIGPLFYAKVLRIETKLKQLLSCKEMDSEEKAERMAQEKADFRRDILSEGPAFFRTIAKRIVGLPVVAAPQSLVSLEEVVTEDGDRFTRPSDPVDFLTLVVALVEISDEEEVAI